MSGVDQAQAILAEADELLRVSAERSVTVRLTGSLAIREHYLGVDHPFTANCLLALALIASNGNEKELAEQQALRALTIYEQTLGPAHPETAVTMTRVALLYQRQEKHEQAEAFYQRAFAIFDQLSVGQKHPKVLQARRNYAALIPQK